jgi:exopolysaccharide biosynthesis polyprenyl glycosylphosphotransferase
MDFRATETSAKYAHLMFNSSLVSRSLLGTAVHFLVDGLLLVLGVTIAAAWRFGEWLPKELFRYLPAVFAAAVVLPCVIYIGGLYANSPVPVFRWSRIRWVISGLGAALLVMLSMGTVDLDARIGRGVLGLGFVLTTVSATLHHLWLHRSLNHRTRRAVCVVACVEDEMAAEILGRGGDRVVLAGVLAINGYKPKGQMALVRLNEDRLLPEQVSMVLVRDRHLVLEDLTPLLRRWRYQAVEIVNVSDLCEEVCQAVPLWLVTESWLFRASSQTGLLYIRKLKRLFDLVMACLFTVALSPILLLGMLLVKFNSPGPVFFRQTRLGRLGREFEIVKLRTMHLDAEKDGPQWSAANDPRVFAVGKWLRRFRVDEIPQLWNILRGEMSFVGPRPERPEFVERLKDVIPFYEERLAIQPGLTGWAQVRFPYGASEEDAWRKHEFDLYYLKHMSVLLDFFILLETVRTVLIGGVRRAQSTSCALSEWPQHPSIEVVAGASHLAATATKPLFDSQFQATTC